jgi:hypothetical protein
MSAYVIVEFTVDARFYLLDGLPLPTENERESE